MPNTLDGLIDDLQTYVVSPLNAFGLGGFLFDIDGEATANNSAQIDDHYAEDNKSFQDQIAIKPMKLTLKGYQGEVVYNAPSADSPTPLQQAVQKLTVLAGFLPQLSAVQQQFQNFSLSTPSDVSLSDAANIYGLVQNIISSTTGQESRQQSAYRYFKSLMNQKILMGLQTPWEFVTNMAIESVISIQDEKTKFMTDFAVTLKQIRIAKTQTGAYQANSSTSQANGSTTTASSSSITASPPSLQGVAALQSAVPTQLGNVPGVDPASAAAPTGPGSAGSLATLLNAIKPLKASQLQP